MNILKDCLRDPENFMIQWLVLLCSRIVVTGKVLKGVLDLHGKHSSISKGLPCGASYGCDLRPVICTAEFSGSLSTDATSYSKSLIMWDDHQFMVLLLVNFDKSKDILRSYFYLYLPFGRESVLKFMCLSSNISVLILNHRISFSCKRVSSPRYITCVHVYFL